MPLPKLANIQPKRILVITLRYLGDTLLVTPLISSLKQAYPLADIDVLLPRVNMGMLAGNKDISSLIPMTAKGDNRGFVKLLFNIFRRYDLSISTQGGDRPVLCAVLAGKFSMGFISENSRKNFWKKWLLDLVLFNENSNLHAVLENLRFCEELAIKPSYKLTPPSSEQVTGTQLIKGKYAVLHIMPQWRYKQWHENGWIMLATYLTRRGFAVVLTGSAANQEQTVLAEILTKLPPSTRNLAGRLSLVELSLLIENAEVFIGPDTGITHLAAATGVKTIALFGPTDPKQWAPWPYGYESNRTPFASIGTQSNKNVLLLQKAISRGCVPCQLEGCNRNQQSFSVCLDEMSADWVIDQLDNFI